MPRFIPNASTANHLRPAPGPPQRPFVIPRRIGRLLPSPNPPAASIAPSTVAIRAVVTVPRSVLPGLRLVLSAPCKTAAVCTKDSLPTPPDSVNFHLIARCLPREERWPGRSSAPLFHAASCPGVRAPEFLCFVLLFLLFLSSCCFLCPFDYTRPCTIAWNCRSQRPYRRRPRRPNLLRKCRQRPPQTPLRTQSPSPSRRSPLNPPSPLPPPYLAPSTNPSM